MSEHARRPDERPLISVVFSFRNERQNIPTLIARLDAMFARPDVDYELLFVNDASDDGSLETLIERARRESARQDHEHVAPIRRGGVRRCAGMAASSGDATIYHGCRPAGSAGSDPAADREMARRRRRRPYRADPAARRERAEDDG